MDRVPQRPQPLHRRILNERTNRYAKDFCRADQMVWRDPLQAILEQLQLRRRDGEPVGEIRLAKAMGQALFAKPLADMAINSGTYVVHGLASMSTYRRGL
jgi:hypothetical protein